MQSESKDILEDIATRLHGLGDVLLFLSESQMDGRMRRGSGIFGVESQEHGK